MLYSTEPTLTIRMPLPNVEVDASKLSQIKSAFEAQGQKLKVVAEDEYPIAPSWAELIILAGAFFTGAVASHYTEKVLDAFDALAKKAIDQINLTIRCGKHSLCRDIPIRDRSKAISEMESALLELKLGVEGKSAMMYWLEKTEIKNVDEIWIYESRWMDDGGHMSGVKIHKPSDPDYDLWKWILETNNDRMIDEAAVDTLKANYKEKGA